MRRRASAKVESLLFDGSRSEAEADRAPAASRSYAEANLSTKGTQPLSCALALRTESARCFARVVVGNWPLSHRARSRAGVGLLRARRSSGRTREVSRYRGAARPRRLGAGV